MNCNDICMSVVISTLSSSSLFLIPFMLTRSTMRFISLLLLVMCGVCSHVVVLGLSGMLFSYTMWMR